MNVVVSNNAIDYIGFIKVSKLEDVLSLTGDIDCLVLHKSNESDEVKIKCLSILKDQVNTMIYIRERESVETAIQMIVVGSGGKYFDDEFFLESSSELKNLIENLGSVTAIVELGGVNTVGEFFNRYLRDGSSSFNKEYLLAVKSAVAGMIAEYKQKDLELLQLSETATEIFANSANLISKVEEERQNLEEAIAKLKEAKDSIPVKTNIATSQSILFFPIVSYMKESNIIRVKEIGMFPHLVPFMLGLRLYLNSIKLVRTKLIVVCPVGEQYEEMYEMFEWVTQSSANTMKGYYSDIVFTNFPSKDVMYRLLDDADYDTFIVLDKLKASNKHILNCKGNSVKYALASESYSDRFKLKPMYCMFPKEVKGSMFSIKHINDYPSEVEQRERLYLRDYKSAYESLSYTKD